MFKPIYILFALGSLIVISCFPPVSFTEYQPKGFKKSDQFLRYYQGVFYCEGDGSTVYIGSKIIAKEMMYKIGVDMHEFEEMEGVSFEDGKLYVKGYDTPFDAFIQNDTLYSDVILKDTIFNLNEQNHVLTEFKGHQIINNKIHDEIWEVLILSLDEQGGIFLSEAYMPEDLTKLKAVTPVTELIEDNDFMIKISPSVREFNQILNEKLIFHACDHFIRIKQPISI